MYTKETDVMHRAFKWIDHNRWLVAGGAVGVVLAVALIGCRARTASLVRSGEKVTAQEFQIETIDLRKSLEQKAAAITQEQAQYNAEVSALNQKIEAGQADLQRQEELRAHVIEVAGGLVSTVASGGAVTPSAAAGAALQLLTLSLLGGSVLNSRRKDKVIEAASGPVGAPSQGA